LLTDSTVKEKDKEKEKEKEKEKSGAVKNAGKGNILARMFGVSSVAEKIFALVQLEEAEWKNMFSGFPETEQLVSGMCP